MIVYKPTLVEVFLKKTIVNIYAGFDFSLVVLEGDKTGIKEIHITGNNMFGQLGVGKCVKKWFNFKYLRSFKG